ncbi:hypothetical protein [Streptomyces paludis]|uniref:hypothetical protein n=1 Tax=Streptomyces paludis TaxID=2282738 RepID=UPI0015F2BB47|nr:hypothetical protein [Streptomyces paludis]
MPGRRFWGIIFLAEYLAFCAIGYKLNGGTPSVPWNLAGLACGALTIFAFSRFRKE